MNLHSTSLLSKPPFFQSAPSTSSPPFTYAFEGVHLVANYISCNLEALKNHAGLLCTMKAAVAASGATLLNFVEHEFEPQGYAVVMLLSESHATIHTYPEHLACFVDIFTCGDHCHVEKFDHIMTKYLQPKGGSKKLLTRTQQLTESKNETFGCIFNQ